MIIGICGDNCTCCPRYIASQENDINALKAVRDLWVRLDFRDPDFPVGEMKCTGCTPNNPCAYTEIRNCALGKKVNTCGHCSTYPCPKIERAFEATENLRSRISAVCTPQERKILEKSFLMKKTYLDAIHQINHK